MSTEIARALTDSRRAFIKRGGAALLSLAMPKGLVTFTEVFNMEQQTNFDIIIIGGSYSGLAAAMALGRALRRVLIIDAGDPCNKQTPHSHNFLTQDGQMPAEIARLGRAQVLKYPTVEFKTGWVAQAAKTSNGFTVQLASGTAYSASKLILATGIKDIMPAIPGFAESWGISVLHCPYCHGYEVKEQRTGILANGDVAFEMASLLANWTKQLTLYTNGAATLSEQQRQKLRRHSIDIVETEIGHLQHKAGYISNIVFKDGTNAGITALYSRLPFTQHSAIPNDIGCEITADGYIKIDAAHRTNIHGVFACGDNVSKMRTVANAVSMGTATGLMVNKELIEERF